MTLYSSREPFNDDPFPRVTIHTGARHRDHLPTLDDATECQYDPRPEYDRPQNNPTNPILTEFRRLVNETGNGLYVTAWLFSGDLLEEWESYPLEQWHHAMDVLQKILSVYKKKES